MEIKKSTFLIRIIAAMMLCVLMLSGCTELETIVGDYSSQISEDLEATTPPIEATTAAHEHNFSEATCVIPKTCTECGITDGEPLPHELSNATCTEAAICKNCGQAVGEAPGHTWSFATCTSPATCEICGVTEGEPNPHEWNAATCLIPSTCKYCGETQGTALAHNWKDATCTEAATCIACGKTKGEPSDHKWASATCTTSKTCKVCNKTKGSTASHKYSKGKCKECGESDPSYDSSSSSMVWIPTNGGKKYHSHSGCSNMKNPQKVSLSKAKSLGFTACKRCY